jgi:hypothetical protein
METLHDIAGLEFDWFAIDQAGCHAVFATAGAGPVPASIHDRLDEHGDIGDSIAVTGWGSPQVWESYARIGLFVYDWDDARGTYVRLATPTARLDEALARRLAAARLPRMAISFAASPSATVERSGEGAA